MIQHSLKRFLSDTKAVSAVEFALIAPILVSLYLAAAELSTALTAQRKVTQVATMVADLVTQDDFITSAELTDIYNAADAVLAPFGGANLNLRITSLRLDVLQDGHYVHWSEGSGMTAYALDDDIVIPGGLLEEGYSVIFVEAAYDHTSALNAVLPGTVTLQKNAYLRPRRSAWVERS